MWKVFQESTILHLVGEGVGQNSINLNTRLYLHVNKNIKRGNKSALWCRSTEWQEQWDLSESGGWYNCQAVKRTLRRYGSTWVMKKRTMTRYDRSYKRGLKKWTGGRPWTAGSFSVGNWRFRDPARGGGREKPRSYLDGRVATIWKSALEDGLLCGSPEGKLHEGRNFCHHIQSRIPRAGT